MGAGMLQSNGPLNAIHANLCGFHFYAGRPSQQVMAIHYCAGMNEEMRQCIIYDSDRKDARMIGVEYIISERLFNTLPEDEKALAQPSLRSAIRPALSAQGAKNKQNRADIPAHEVAPRRTPRWSSPSTTCV